MKRRLKIERGDPLVSPGSANSRKRFWLKQGRETANAGFRLNRLTFGEKTSRKRPKSAPYLRLKNSRTSKWQVLFYRTRKTQKLDRIGALKGGRFRIF